MMQFKCREIKNPCFPLVKTAPLPIPEVFIFVVVFGDKCVRVGGNRDRMAC